LLQSLINVAVLAVIASLLGACATPGSSRRSGADAGGDYPATVKNGYAKALGYMDAGDDVRAQRALEAFGEAYPEYAGAQVNLGIIYDRNGRPDAAEAAFRRAVSVCTECAAAYNHLGIVQRQKGLFDEAEQSYLRAIEANPDYALAYYNLGVLYDLYRGRPDLALQYYEAYVEHAGAGADVKDVNKWIIDLQRRIGQPQRAARTGETQ